MTVLLIPLAPELSSYTESVLLDGVTYRLRFRINTRIGAWLMDVFKDDGTPIVYGRRCVVDWPLLRQHRYLPEAPAGEMIPYDTTHRRMDPGEDDFGSRVILTYLDAASVGG